MHHRLQHGELRPAGHSYILYSGNQIVLFYGSNSWSYTRLGRIEYSTQAELES
ncbi:MAG: hypothetical protein II692_05885, partial [Paludibacteraceae bacterium]|nr:hypothetical protein [Paludibacteraceae bacterium]